MSVTTQGLFSTAELRDQKDILFSKDDSVTDSMKAVALGKYLALAGTMTATQSLKARLDPTKLGESVINDAASKADSIFEQEQKLIQSIGGLNSDSTRNLLKMQKDMYSGDILRTKSADGQGEIYMKYFKSEQDILNQFLGIIDDNNLLTVHIGNKINAKSAADLILTGKALGFQKGAIQSFLERQFALTGKVDDTLLRQTLAYSKAVERKTGISSKVIAENVSVMMKEVSKFGVMTSLEMTRAASLVAKLGLKMGSVSGLVGQFNNFESAAQSVAKLSQALGVQIDVIDAVNMANSGDTVGLVTMIKEQFDASNIDVHTLGLPMKRALADIFNVGDIKQVEQMFGNASSGLDQFLSSSDEALAGVSESNIKTALKDAQDSIGELDRMQGSVEDAIEKAFKASLDSVSTRLATTTVKIKKKIRTEMYSTSSEVAQSIRDGMLKDVLSGAEHTLLQVAKQAALMSQKLRLAINNQEEFRKLLNLESKAETKARKARVRLADQKVDTSITRPMDTLIQQAKTGRANVIAMPKTAQSAKTASNVAALDMQTSFVINNQEDIDAAMKAISEMDPDITNTDDDERFTAVQLKDILAKFTKALETRDKKDNTIKVIAADGMFNFIDSEGKKLVTTRP